MNHEQEKIRIETTVKAFIPASNEYLSGFILFLFLTLQMADKKYKVFGIVTNIKETEMNGEDHIHRLHARCGISEEVHAVMKDDLAGGKLPSADFGENAAWWWIMIIALNLNAMLKNIALLRRNRPTILKKIPRFSFGWVYKKLGGGFGFTDPIPI